MLYIAAVAVITGSLLVKSQTISETAQLISQLDISRMSNVQSPTYSNWSTPFIPPGSTLESLHAKPFHIYDMDFLAVIGDSPTLTMIAKTTVDPLFHEAATWYPAKDEMFFSQNAGAIAAGTGLNKSSVIQKISMADAAAAAERGGNPSVNVTVIGESPQVINPNGATNYQGQMVWLGQGQGDGIGPTISLVHPEPPYNTTVLLTSFYGRQFNSLNDVTLHPKNGDLYFTDTTYAYLQYFRPPPAIQNQVYRFNPQTGAVTVVADGFSGRPNGVTFSPDGTKAYATDSGTDLALMGANQTTPATIYTWDVQPDGTWDNRKVFAFMHRGIPDGIHCDSNGNVYTGNAEGVIVYNPSGKLLGKIYTGTTSANFMFACGGRMIILSETEMWYATLAAEGGGPIFDSC